jgi:hypothetical protein
LRRTLKSAVSPVNISFLEMLTYVWRQQEGKPLPVFGLPDRILAALDKIMDHTGLDHEQALEQALAVYLQKLGLVKTKSAAEKG